MIFRTTGFSYPLLILLAGLFLFPSCGENERQPIVWRLNDVERIGEFTPEILGNPAVVFDSDGVSLSFDGVDDGLILPVNPVEGWDQFTVEVLFKPASDGPEAQRFVHFQDRLNHRCLIETRMSANGTWALDTFLYNGRTEEGLTLIDRKNQHPADEWYWVALTYNGKEMTHYVNGVEELSGEIALDLMERGEISLGVRLNRVHWYKGQIREIRFHPKALGPSELEIIHPGML